LQVKDPVKDLVEPAVKGVENILKSCLKSSVKKLVLTSSANTIDNRSIDNPGKIYTEEDWNTDNTIKGTPYGYSKVQAEKFAWKFVKDLPEDKRFELVTICPELIIGPQLHDSIPESNVMIKRLMTGELPAMPQLNFGIADVRDVARAHILAAENPQAKGRYIASSCKNFWMVEMGGILKKSFPKECKAPSFVVPNLFAYIGAIFDKQLTWGFLSYYLGKVSHFDNSKIKKDLGMDFMDPEQSVIDTAQSMLDKHLV